MMLSQYQQALEDARASVSLDAAFVKGYIRIAKCCLSLGDAVSAGQALDKASHIEPKNAAVMQVRYRGGVKELGPRGYFACNKFFAK